MMEILPSCTIDVQREIILSLPDILDDSQHEKVANSLKVTLDKTSELTCTILDCLTNLSLDGGGVLKELLDIVLKRLGRIDLDDLPTVVEFIISTSQGGDYIDVVQELRDRLDLSPPNSSKTDHRTQTRRKETKDVQCIILEIGRAHV